MSRLFASIVTGSVGESLDIRQKAGTKLASASADGILRLWEPRSNEASLKGDVAWQDPTSGTCSDLLEATEPRGFASCISWAPDGVRLATGYQDGEVVVWYPHAALPTVSCSGHTNQVRCIAWSPQGKDCVASGSLDGTVRIWEPKKGKCLKTCQGDGGYVYCLLWHPEATSLAAGSTDGIARLFDPLTGTCIVRWEGHVGHISSLAWGPGATSLATGSHDGSAFIWGVDTGRQVACCSTPGRVYTIAWRNDSQRPRLATGSSEGSICIFDASLGVCMTRFQGHFGAVFSLAWSTGPDDSLYLASGGEDGTVRVWEARAAQCLAVHIGHAAGVICVRWAPKGKRIASASEDGLAKIWDIA
ncbi:Vegetative incompatibility protein HET-E-1 [Symbiodinium microadriaticum]|uniref:Vegetative incompatibility protein HET-E-1 n=1 Tax=Symbiodinium microadriaticum TaxID=2951 RepID=A0A1Q9EYX8_SYMMI|nr:Vegetative incompatibility protein HET-E-1 [Symbiodinium microadriaticum]